MKVLNLQCGHRHSFEGWFGSEDDFQSQLARGLVECPICADKAIFKMPSAPRLNFGGHRELTEKAQPSIEPASPESAALEPGTSLATMSDAPEAFSPEHQAAFLNAVRQVLANTENVGDKFAHQARAMHYGEVEARSIRGHTTKREAAELIEEGIDVMSLPLPAALKETLQ